jgi:hypothetical protein
MRFPPLVHILQHCHQVIEDQRQTLHRHRRVGVFLDVFVIDDMLSVPGTMKVSITTLENGNRNSGLEALKYIRVWAGTLTSIAPFPDACTR